jgi:hypothetical protein
MFQTGLRWAYCGPSTCNLCRILQNVPKKVAPGGNASDFFENDLLQMVIILLGD